MLLSSCTTYTIPMESFRQQFDTINSTKLIDVTTIGPVNELYRYKANPISLIKCVNKNGEPAQLLNRPSIELRATYGHKKKRVIFYFDRIYVENGLLVGYESRFLSFIGRKIPLDSISKIEVQDGRKRFRYLN